MPNNKPLVSVIMPIYNGEKWLTNALSSLSDQIFKNFEILLIDDGSTDASGKICQSFAEQDARAHYFLKENGGVSSARNLGLQKAKGEFIYFFDCDDIITSDALEFLLKLQKVNQADIASCSFITVTEQVIPDKFKKQNNDLEIIDAPEDKWEKGEDFTNILRCKLFTRKVIGDTRFYEQIHYAEDNLFATEVFIKADKVIYSPAIKVFYYLHDESATHRKQPYQFFEGLVEAKFIIKEKVYAATNNKNIRYFVYRDYGMSIFTLFRYTVRSGDKNQYEQVQHKYASFLKEFLAKEKFPLRKCWEYKTYINSYMIARILHTRKI